jgi:hypothetical protein
MTAKGPGRQHAARRKQVRQTALSGLRSRRPMDISPKPMRMDNFAARSGEGLI